MKSRASNDFDDVLRASETLAESLPGHVFIGGVAVYVHTVNNSKAQTYAEASHDSDVVISFDDLSSLRDEVEVVSNRRLKKSQAMIEGVAIDVYVERSNGLAIPYDELYAHAMMYEHLRVACPEHLLVLKLVAACDREGSSKGDKDARDLVRLSLLGGAWHRDLILPYLSREHITILDQVSRSRVFSDMCNYNEHEAKKLRQKFESFLRSSF